MPDDRNCHEQAAEEQAPEATPERAACAPELDAIACSVEADDFLLAVVALAYNAQVLHLKAGRGQLFDGGFGGKMVCKNRDHCVSFFHLMLLLNRMTATDRYPASCASNRTRVGKRPAGSDRCGASSSQCDHSCGASSKGASETTQPVCAIL